MLKKSLFVINFLFVAFLLNAAESVVPLPKVDCKLVPGAIHAAPVPWKGDFTITGNGARKAEAQTRAKFFHNGTYLLVALEMLEPNMSELKDSYTLQDYDKIWRNDSIELNIDASGKALQLAKIVVDCKGNINDYFGYDDNTGNDRYVLNNDWQSHTQVISCTRGSDRWSLELAVPLGILYDGERNIGKVPTCRFNIARNRWAVFHEASVLYPINGAKNNGLARQFPVISFENFDAQPFAWQVEGIALKATKGVNGKEALATCQVINRSPRFRNFQMRFAYVDAKGNVLATGKKMGPGYPNKLSPIQIPIPIKTAGDTLRGKLLIEVCNGKGELLCCTQLAQNLEWQPYTIQMITPWYRNNIYATMPEIKEIEAEIRAQEGIGKPLTVTLTGPNGFKKEQTIPKLAEVNRVKFPFAGTAEGDYFVTAGKISVKIRKLPYCPGEVWLDRDRVVYVDGKKYFPIGGYGGGAKGAFSHSTAIWKSVEHLKTTYDKYWGPKGYKMSLYPFLDETPDKIHFGNAARQKSRLTPEQKERIKMVVDTIKTHPVTFAYYLADEPEGFGHNEEWYEDALKFLQEIDPYHPATITNYGLDGQRRYYRGCDILFSDCYPDYYEGNLTGQHRNCNYRWATQGNSLRPTWQMLQSFDWGRCHSTGAPGRGPTYDEIREQAFSAIPGDVKAIMYYVPSSWGRYTYDMRLGVDLVTTEILSMQDILLRPTTLDVEVPAALRPSILCGSKVGLNGERMIIAINLSHTPVQVTFTVKNAKLPGTLSVAGEKRTVKTSGNTFTDTLQPHAPQLYVTEGIPTDGVDLPAMRKKIAELEAGRKKPGNLAYIGPAISYWNNEARKGNWRKDLPIIRCSSDISIHRPLQLTTLFLGDGICETESLDVMTWTPSRDDKEPWVEIEFPKEETVGRVCLYSVVFRTKTLLKSGRLLIPEGNGWKEVASFKDNTRNVLEISFTPVKTRRLRLAIDDYLKYDRLLHEWEVYAK